MSPAKKSPARKSRARTAAIAHPTIAELMQAYIADGGERVQQRRRWALVVLEDCLNGYAYQSLKPADTRLYDRLYNVDGAGHREYCEIFGAERIVPELRQFFGWFLIRKVMARPNDLAEIVKETGRFVAWLGAREHITPSAAAAGAALVAEASVAVPSAEEAAQAFQTELAGMTEVPAEAVEGRFIVVRLARGKAWLESYEDGKTYGPLAIPKGAMARLQEGWELSGAVGRIGRRWALVEVWNVYPGVGE